MYICVLQNCNWKLFSLHTAQSNYRHNNDLSLSLTTTFNSPFPPSSFSSSCLQFYKSVIAQNYFRILCFNSCFIFVSLHNISLALYVPLCTLPRLTNGFSNSTLAIALRRSWRQFSFFFLHYFKAIWWYYRWKRWTHSTCALVLWEVEFRNCLILILN